MEYCKSSHFPKKVKKICSYMSDIDLVVLDPRDLTVTTTFSERGWVQVWFAWLQSLCPLRDT